MPELPEVETVRRGLLPVLQGRLIDKIQIRRFDLRRPVPRDLAQRFKGRRITDIRRRAKYILIDSDDNASMILHLGMSGRIGVGEKGGEADLGPHDHVLIDMAGGTRITFTDPRRFGILDWTNTDQLESHVCFRHLGIEPLEPTFDGVRLMALAHGRARPLKTFLLDQSVIVGVGNIYASEALHQARLSPRRMARTLGPCRAGRLARAISSVLTRAIAAGGSSLRDHAQVNGELGYFQHMFAVYDRAGAECPRPACGGVIRRIVQAGRSSFYCPTCQR